MLLIAMLASRHPTLELQIESQLFQVASRSWLMHPGVAQVLGPYSHMGVLDGVPGFGSALFWLVWSVAK